MQPGPDLDAEIARKILEVVVILDTETGQYKLRDVENRTFVPVPPYSTDTTAAHELISKYKAAGCTFAISNTPEGTWSVTIRHAQVPVNFGANGQTLAHAICQAVLQFNNLFKITRST